MRAGPLFPGRADLRVSARRHASLPSLKRLLTTIMFATHHRRNVTSLTHVVTVREHGKLNGRASAAPRAKSSSVCLPMTVTGW